MQNSIILKGGIILKSFLATFEQSAKEFTKVRTLAVTGIFIALNIVLGFFSISVTSYLKIGFSFLALAAIGMLYGPVVGLAAGALCDIIGFIVKPSGPFLIIFTLIAMLSGFIYGLFLYKKEGRKLTVFAIISKATVTLVCNIFLNTLALVHYGFIPPDITSKAILTRVIKNLVELPVGCAMLIAVLMFVNQAYKRVFNKSTI